jgi:hypothetical protein
LPSTIEVVVVEADDSLDMISNVERSLSTPSWWMPDSCWNALRPTTALLGWTP